MQSLLHKKLLHIKAHGGTISQSAEHQRESTTAENSCLWMVDRDAGFIVLSTWPLSTWNTQVLWLLQPPWHELSIRSFESNSPTGLCHLYFHNCLESWFSGALSDRSVLPHLASPVISWDKEIPSCCQTLHAHSIIHKAVGIIITPFCKATPNEKCLSFLNYSLQK